MRRYEDWLRQARKDLERARKDKTEGDYEWACFIAQQSAEKAVKALFQFLGIDAWGHSVSHLLEALPEERKPASELLDKAKELDRHYIPSRYPNSHPTGAPMDYFTSSEAERAVQSASEVISFVEDQVKKH